MDNRRIGRRRDRPGEVDPAHLQPLRYRYGCHRCIRCQAPTTPERQQRSERPTLRRSYLAASFPGTVVLPALPPPAPLCAKSGTGLRARPGTVGLDGYRPDCRPGRTGASCDRHLELRRHSRPGDGRCRCGLGSCDQGLDRAVRQGLISERPDTPVIKELLDDLIPLRGRRDVSRAVAGTELGLCVG